MESQCRVCGIESQYMLVLDYCRHVGGDNFWKCFRFTILNLGILHIIIHHATPIRVMIFRFSRQHSFSRQTNITIGPL